MAHEKRTSREGADPFWAASGGVLKGCVDEKGRAPHIDNIVDMVYTSRTILSSWKGVFLRHPWEAPKSRGNGEHESGIHIAICEEEPRVRRGEDCCVANSSWKHVRGCAGEAQRAAR
jgi:hypothetical protein